MEPLRKPLQGVRNIVRFNWHFYLVALVLALVLIAAAVASPPASRGYIRVLLALLSVPVLTSLAVSAYVYDFSELYRLNWLPLSPPPNPTLLNVSAGLDEISSTLQLKYAPSHLIAVDFYDPSRHREVSIRRARRAYPPFPGTRPVDSRARLPLPDNSIDLTFAFLATHEIRDGHERAAFFQELRRVTRPTGLVVVTEHLRDPANLLAYSIGFLHFHSRQVWLETFHDAGLQVSQEIKITPFITSFLLRKNGSPA